MPPVMATEIVPLLPPLQLTLETEERESVPAPELETETAAEAEQLLPSLRVTVYNPAERLEILEAVAPEDQTNEYGAPLPPLTFLINACPSEAPHKGDTVESVKEMAEG